MGFQNFPSRIHPGFPLSTLWGALAWRVNRGAAGPAGPGAGGGGTGAALGWGTLGQSVVTEAAPAGREEAWAAL